MIQFKAVKEKIPDMKEISMTEMTEKTPYEMRCFFQRVGRGLTEDCQILLDCRNKTVLWEEALVTLIVEAVMQGGYFFRKEGLKRIKISSVFRERDRIACYPKHQVFMISSRAIGETIEKAVLLSKCIGYARMLGDLPGNYLHSEELSDYTKELAATYALELQIYRRAELEQMGCEGILSVNQASEHEAELITLAYEGKKGAPFYALVGKGLLYDAGGYHLKSIEGMEGMKYDMCGAAGVLELAEYFARAGEPVNLFTVFPAVENVIAPDGLKMGDVITTMSGKTVEIYNTDAEGRLVLCDALTLACQKADTVLDFATLTYSCKNALGNQITGFFCNEEELSEALFEAAGNAGEKIWRLPLDPIFHEQLKWSKTADLMNYVPGKGAGASIAACFLEEFIPEGVRWAHFDMAGTAVCTEDSPKAQAGASGVIIGMAAAFIKEQSGKG